ncbi:MAG TPA: hypothetical protein VKX39_18040 [Bryobacteraceae bacterium]|jgi:hypothetical protein|nr:hypothetical protein [Bryobacteraceae bacterium]
MTTIWSLKNRREIAVRIYYTVQNASPGRLIRLERIERFEEVSF